VTRAGTAGFRSPLHRLQPLARYAFWACVMVLGILHVIFGEELARVLRGWPDGLPGRPLWAHGWGALLAVVAGILLFQAGGRRAAVVLTGVLLLPVVGLHLPEALASGELGNAWLGLVKWLAMASAPLVVAWHIPVDRSSPWPGRLVSLGRSAAPWLMGIFMIVSAIMHVRFADFVSELMQPWMPWRLFWTYFAAVALTLGGIGLVVPRTARLAAILTSVMILSWFFLVHTPRMLVDPQGPVGWSEMAESMAFAAMVLLLAVREPRTGSGTARSTSP
jgi:uncharacterized membrane protein YphA (DoxX/SURF4 family)